MDILILFAPKLSTM